MKTITRMQGTLTLGILALALVAVPVSAGTLAGTLSQQQVFNANLTTQGGEDWAVWGYAGGGTSTSLTPDVQMNGGSGISALTNITNGNGFRGLGQFGNYGESTFDWSNGTPTPAAAGAFTGLQHNGEFGPISNVGEGFAFTVPAGTAEQLLTLYSTVNDGNAQLTATLSDGSAVQVVQLLQGTGFNIPYVSTFSFSANSNGQTLTIEEVLTSDISTDNSGNVAIQGAALAAAAPEPGSFGLLGIAAMGLIAARKKLRLNSK